MRRVWWKGSAFVVAAVIATAVTAGVAVDVTDRTSFRCAAEDGNYPKPPGFGKCSVGIPPGTVLRDCGENATIATEGITISGCEWTGSVLITVPNVAVLNSRIHGAIRTQNGNDEASFVIKDSDLGPASGCGGIEALIGIQNYTAERVYLHNNGDGFRVSGSNISIKHSMVKLCSNPEDHGDGIQGFGGGCDVEIEHVTVDQRAAVDYTAPIFFADNSGCVHVTYSLLLASNGTGDPNIQDTTSAAIKLHQDGPRDPSDNPRWVAEHNRLIGRAGNVNNPCAEPETVWSDNRQITVDANYRITSLGKYVTCGGTLSDAG